MKSLGQFLVSCAAILGIAALAGAAMAPLLPLAVVMAVLGVCLIADSGTPSAYPGVVRSAAGPSIYVAPMPLFPWYHPRRYFGGFGPSVHTTRTVHNGVLSPSVVHRGPTPSAVHVGRGFRPAHQSRLFAGTHTINTRVPVIRSTPRM